MYRRKCLAAANPSHAMRAPHRLFNGMFAVKLLAIMRGRLQKAAFERPVEAGRVLVSNGMCNFLDAQVAVREKMGGSLESLFAQPLSQTNAGLLLE